MTQEAFAYRTLPRVERRCTVDQWAEGSTDQWIVGQEAQRTTSQRIAHASFRRGKPGGQTGMRKRGSDKHPIDDCRLSRSRQPRTSRGDEKHLRGLTGGEVEEAHDEHCPKVSLLAPWSHVTNTTRTHARASEAAEYTVWLGKPNTFSDLCSPFRPLPVGERLATHVVG